MQGCKQGDMNLKIQGRKDARIQESAHKHKDMFTSPLISLEFLV